MMIFIRRIWVPAVVVLLAGLSIVFARTLKQVQGEDLTSQIGLDQKLDSRVPLEAKVVDEEGNTVRFGRFFGKRPVVLLLVFYRCVDRKGVCLLEMEGAVKSFRAMKKNEIGKDYDVVAVSIHPKETHELAKVKKEQFLRDYGRPESRPGWHFLTGETSEVKKIADSVGFRYKYDAAKDQILHPAGLVVLSPQGKVSKYFYGYNYASPLMNEAIEVAAKEGTGFKEEPRLLGCFMYDPASGKTRLHVQNALKVGGFSTLFILIISIFSMNRMSARRSGHHEDKEDALR
jgi:protein SCO1